MAMEVFNFTIENKFKENSTGEKVTLQVIPVHGIGQGGKVMPNTPAKPFKLTSSDGFIIFKIKCLNNEIGIKDYITVDTNHKVQLSVTNKCWRLRIARKQSNDLHQESPINIEVGRYESDRQV
ncbi:MAG: hypothetical protein JSV88_09185 [Candidatus Aminicenantes bacterium]|nr:MAG: hypothetical protein JSV88_09185 [Candidatus Aminicenantes bacterium]